MTRPRLHDGQAQWEAGTRETRFREAVARLVAAQAGEDLTAVLEGPAVATLRAYTRQGEASRVAGDWVAWRKQALAKALAERWVQAGGEVPPEGDRAFWRCRRGQWSATRAVRRVAQQVWHAVGRTVPGGWHGSTLTAHEAAVAFTWWAGLPPAERGRVLRLPPGALRTAARAIIQLHGSV